MSEEISTPTTEVVVETAGTDVETTDTVNANDLIETPKDERKKKFNGRDRVAEALEQAKNGPLVTPETMTVETLSEVEGLDEGGHKGIDYNRVIKELPEEAQKLLSNLRADYTRKTQELSKERKELEAVRKSMAENPEFNKQINELADAETVELDPYNTESFEQRIQQEVARRMQELIKPVQEEQHQMRKRAQLDQFKAEHPDLMDYKEPIAKLLKDNQNISLEDAYFIVKGKSSVEQNAKLKRELEERTNRMREVGLKLSTGGTRAVSQVPKHLKKGHEIYNWLKNNKIK